MSRGGRSTLVGSTSIHRRPREPQLLLRLWYALLGGRWLVKPFKGMSAEPTARYRRSSVTEHGMAYRPRGPGSRSRGSSRGSHAPPGDTGEPCTGQSTTGGRNAGSHEVREMRKARVALALRMTTGELTEIERLTVSSERGGWKSARRGNSLAAYSTARTVLWGEGHSIVSLLPTKSGAGGVSSRVT